MNMIYLATIYTRMHIPDHFLNGNVSGPLLAGALGVFSRAFVQVKKKIARRVSVRGLATFPPTDAGTVTSSELTVKSKEKILRMATVASFIFAAQMFNFPISHGTSGHFVGAVLAALVLGPWESVLLIGIILAIQALLFGDGGMLAWGANVLNMAIIAGLGGWYVFKVFSFIKSFFIRAGVVAWLTIVLASVAASVELALSNTISFGEVLRAMVSIHALIGIGEALITVGLLMYLKKKKQPIEALKNEI